MYIPHSYKKENLNEVKEFLKKNSFGILVNQVDGKPWATHIPLELDVDQEGNDILVSHISKANPQWKSFEDKSEVLCIFNGPHSYISSSWYKEEEVPTWNYVAVHIYGKIKILNEAEVLVSLHKLVDKYEANSKNPVSVVNFSEKTMRQIKGVVGFQIKIDNIQAAYKLSQGREHDHAKIVTELNETQNSGSKAIASAIKNLPKSD
ncbi:FMN-binding negative transcriptional regulator [Maribacter sp. HTCC2170]|uniref:FMN-binding negative transcriptional regulator n=1 Tax=Maribacter sp. (strain HTCC2170 / KCCM 42371) TaxID=313603 RepID=UPI00006B47A6|nr:FMN-binding negative transcriptional regulator [Maribacter sp. HTCC2170]EAR01690.1 probable transcriptional regulator [Maribacter sp. HTCC2170]